MITLGASETRPGSSPALDAGAFAPGTMLVDRYRIVALAGRGGMGEVYRAEDLRLGQTVALKFLPASLAHDSEARERLLAEVRSARTVSHPNVCRVYDVGEVQDRAFLTMEYIDGEDLRSLLRRIGRLPPGKTLEIVRQLIAGLAAAHDRGVLHRDLKPANVMIDGCGQARITDFGLAVQKGPENSPADFAGTIAYMAPERFAGMPATVQSDLYSLGLVMYEACTGKSAFKASTVGEWQRAHTDSTPTSPTFLVSDINPAIERAILRCLEKDPARRPVSASQLANALPGGDPLAAAIAAGETPSPALVAASGEEGTLARWRAWLALAGCAAGIALMMLVGSTPWKGFGHVILPHPELQQERARQILRTLGYGEPPADYVWWMRFNGEYLAHFRRTTDRGRALAGATANPVSLLFCYRQSPAPLSTDRGRVAADDPPQIWRGDAYLELGTDGQLVELRVVPDRRDLPPSPSQSINWSPLLAAAGLDATRLTPVQPEWGPAQSYDTRAAWEGIERGEGIRVEAAARHGRATYLRVTPTWMAGSAERPVVTSRAWPILVLLIGVVFLGSEAMLAVLAVRNLRRGRGDRRSAFRVAGFVFATLTIGDILLRHFVISTGTPALLGSSPVGRQIRGTFSLPLYTGLQLWLAYIALEPYVRRRWPHLLIASTRLLDGRWRDPLVGRSLLVGVLAALAVAVYLQGSLALIQAMGWGVLSPAFLTAVGLDGLRTFLGYVLTAGGLQIQFAVLYLAVLVLARLVLRSDRAAWTGMTVVFLVFFGAWGWVFYGPSPAVLGSFVFAMVATSVLVFWKNGLLALAVWILVLAMIRNTAWTPALTRWYATSTWVTTVLICALALWGFRNVLGRQSVFPTGSLDE